jgi:hypothetical protein
MGVPMKLASSLSEAARNVISGASRALLFALALSAGLIVLAEFELTTVSSLVSRTDAFVAAGGSTFVLVAEGSVDPHRCEDLVRTGQVDAAGALRAGPALRFAGLPSNPVASYEVTAGLMALVAPTHRSAEVLYSAGLADTVQLGLPQPYVGRVADGVYSWPEDGRQPALQYAALTAVPPRGAFDACWARASDPSVDLSVLLRSVLIRAPGDSSEVSVDRLNARLGQGLDTKAEFGSRPSRISGALAAVFAALLAAAALRLRALELATASSVGVPRVSLLAQHLIEAFVWVGVGVVAMLAYSALRSHYLQPDRAAQLFEMAVPIGLAGLAGGLVGTAALVLWAAGRDVDTFLRSRTG